MLTKKNERAILEVEPSISNPFMELRSQAILRIARKLNELSKGFPDHQLSLGSAVRFYIYIYIYIWIDLTESEIETMMLLRSGIAGSIRRITSTSSLLLRHSSNNQLDYVQTDKENVIFCPPNLKIDYRAKSSPFYGLAKLDDDHEESASSSELDNDVDDNEDDFEDVMSKLDNLSIAYDASDAVPRVHYAIPLPDRLTVPIRTLQGNKETGGGEKDLPLFVLNEDLFGMHPIRKDLIHRVVIYQRNKKRGLRYPALTKTIHTKSGSGKKMRPQKGQGRARAGHKRAAHWRGGAKAHGPKGNVQDYTTKLNKKVRKLGLKHMLSQKLMEGNLIIVNNYEIDSYKTKDLSKSLIDLGAIGGRYGTTAFIVDADISVEQHANFRVAQRNIRQVKFVSQLGCNVYDILKMEKLVLSVDAVNALQKRLSQSQD